MTWNTLMFHARETYECHQLINIDIKNEEMVHDSVIASYKLHVYLFTLIMNSLDHISHGIKCASSVALHACIPHSRLPFIYTWKTVYLSNLQFRHHTT